MIRDFANIEKRYVQSNSGGEAGISKLSDIWILTAVKAASWVVAEVYRRQVSRTQSSRNVGHVGPALTAPYGIH